MLRKSSPQTEIGRFQGKFEKNLLAFNPGWAADANEENPKADVSAEGQACFISENPEGNLILVDLLR